MAVVLVDGFDHYPSSGFSVKGWSSSTGGTGSNSTATGRFAKLCLKVFTGNTQNSSASLSKLLPSTYATAICGFAFQTDLANGGAGAFYAFLSSGLATIASLGLNSQRQLEVKNSGGTVIATSSQQIILNNWYYIEVKIFVNGASGTCQVRVNGVDWIASTTGNFGSTNIGAVYFQAIYNNTPASNWYFDDVYVADTSGSAPNNTFLGDVRVATLYPSADGAHAQWTPNSGSNHYDRVNDQSGTYPNGDTSYNSDSTPGDYDTFVFDDLPASAQSVFAVQTNLYARKDDAGTRQLAPVVRHSSTDNDGATITLGSGYQFYTQIYESNPGTSSAWTVSDVNGDEFGVKVVA